MNERPRDVLRLQPQMIPAMRGAVSYALDQLDAALGDLRRRGNLTEPWLGDETSQATAVHYSDRAMTGPDSSLGALEAYRLELLRVHDTLARMEDEYRRNEGDRASDWGLRA